MAIKKLTASERAKWISDRYVQFVDIVFGVVVVQGFVRYDDLILDISSSWFTFTGLVCVYLVTVFSWIGYHKSMAGFPYTEARSSWWRMFADFFIVSVYAFLLFSIEDLSTGPESANLSSYLLGYCLIFVGYILSGIFRIAETKKHGASQLLKSTVTLVTYSLMLILYPLTKAYIGNETGNWLLLVLSPFPHFAYRLWRHK